MCICMYIYNINVYTHDAYIVYTYICIYLLVFPSKKLILSLDLPAAKLYYVYLFIISILSIVLHYKFAFLLKLKYKF